MLEQQESVKAIREANEHLDEQTFQDIFRTWGRHQKLLYQLCNKLLQYHIMVQKLPPESVEKLPIRTSTKDLEVQWMADRYLTARVEGNYPVFGSWLASAHWCYQVAKARKGSDPNTAYDKLEGSGVKQTKLSLFEETRPMEVGKRVRLGKEAMDIREAKLRAQGEPYNDQKAAGLHPTDEEDLMKILESTRGLATEEASPGKKKGQAKKKAATSGRIKVRAKKKDNG